MCSNEPPTNASSPSRLPIQFTMESSQSSNGGPRALLPIDQYRLQLYQYAVAERLRYPLLNPFPASLPCYPALFPRTLQPEEPKPQHSYIGLIAMAILSSPDGKLVLSDIYQHILDHYPYFRSRGPGWRNSIRHNLSLNDCFIKAGRSSNGKGHYWSLHPSNLDDFKKGDFRRRKAQRRVRKYMGLAVDDDGADSPSPPPLSVSPPVNQVVTSTGSLMSAATAVTATAGPSVTSVVFPSSVRGVVNSRGAVAPSSQSGSRKRQFDVASLLAPDSDGAEDSADEDIDVVSSDQHHGGSHQHQQYHPHHLHHQGEVSVTSSPSAAAAAAAAAAVAGRPPWPMFPIVNYYQALLQARPSGNAMVLTHHHQAQDTANTNISDS